MNEDEKREVMRIAETRTEQVPLNRDDIRDLVQALFEVGKTSGGLCQRLLGVLKRWPELAKQDFIDSMNGRR